MRRRLLLLALWVGCGTVQDPGPPDGSPPVDLLGGTLRSGCVLALHMDEAAWSGAGGEVEDDCGGDNPGTVMGQGTTTVAGGVRGRAGSFSGSACIEIPDAAALHGTTGLTLSAWILPTALDPAESSVSNGVISKRNDFADQAEYSLYVWTRNHVWVDLDTENNRFEGTANIVNSVWAQLTLVYDGTRPEDQRVRVYVNGSLDVTMPEASAALTAYTSPLHVGCMPAPAQMTQQNFLGEIDEVVIWNRALGDAEIMQWYTNTRP